MIIRKYDQIGVTGRAVMLHEDSINVRGILQNITVPIQHLCKSGIHDGRVYRELNNLDGAILYHMCPICGTCTEDLSTLVEHDEIERLVCPDCEDAEARFCSCCGEVVENDDYIINDELMCESCAGDYYVCDCCGDHVHMDYATSIDDGMEIYCDSCASNNAFYCESCNTHHSDSTEAYEEYNTYTVRCLDGVENDGLTICSDCGYTFDGDGEEYCPNCIDDHADELEDEEDESNDEE